MTRIIQLSDIHFGGEAKAPTEAAVAFTQAAKPDLVLVTGDITLNGLPREFEAGAAWLQRLPDPKLVTPGNHDTPYWNLILRAATPFARYRRWIGVEGGEAFDSAAAHLSVRTINTARGAQPRPDWSKGAINLDRCRMAVAEMEAAGPTSLRVVACHHPLVEATGAPVTGGVHRGDDAACILALGGVDLILTGHVHNPFATPLPFGDGYTYAVGAGTLSERVRGTPTGFNCIEWDGGDVIVTAMGWAGSHFEPYRTWSLPLRARQGQAAA